MTRRKGFRMDLMSASAAATLLLGMMFLLGGALGCGAAAGIDGTSGLALRDYLTAYLTLAEEGQTQTGLLFLLWERLRCPLLVLMLSFTSVGLGGIPVLFLGRGFLFSFSVACFFRLFGWAGLAPALFLFGLPALLWCPALFVLGTQGMGRAYALFSRGRGEGRSRISDLFWVRSGACIGVTALCGAFEAFALPALVGASAGAVL